MTQPGTRAQRLAMPLARDVVRDLAISHGGCVRPVQLRRTDLDTGPTEPVLVPCGHTLAAVCPSCAERARTLRAAQCREGWHLDHEPIVQADDPDDEQRMWIELRADAQRCRDQADAGGQDTAEDDAAIGDLDEQITRSGMRGNVLPARPVRRHRSTRRRQDTPHLPRRKIAPRTIGKTYEARDGKTFRPSMFITLTCPSYGRVGKRRHPGRPGPLRLPAGGAGCAALRGAVRPVHPEPAPLPRPRRPVLRRRRTPTAPRPAHPHRHARHPVPHRAAPGARRHLPPGLVARPTHGQARRRQPAGLARGQRPLPRPRDRRSPADLGPGPRRHRPRRRAAARGPVRRPVRRPGRHRRVDATRTGASATSPST